MASAASTNARGLLVKWERKRNSRPAEAMAARDTGPTVHVCFTPDEEVGRGPRLDLHGTPRPIQGLVPRVNEHPRQIQRVPGFRLGQIARHHVDAPGVEIATRDQLLEGEQGFGAGIAHPQGA